MESSRKQDVADRTEKNCRTRTLSCDARIYKKIQLEKLLPGRIVVDMRNSTIGERTKKHLKKKLLLLFTLCLGGERGEGGT